MEATRKEDIRVIEHYLRNYRTYKAGIKNLQRQLDFIMPNVTDSYEVDDEDATGTVHGFSSVEKFEMDCLQSKHVRTLQDNILQYKILIESIDIALEETDEMEQEFVENRYFEGRTIKETSIEMGYGEKHIFNVRNRLLKKLLISLRAFVKSNLSSN